MAEPRTVGQVHLHQEGAVAVITLDNPPVNSSTDAVRRGILAALGRIDAQRTTAVVLTGTGQHLMAGADLRVPFLGGTPCLQQPLRRTNIQWSAGSAGGVDCTGAYTLDFNAWIAGGNDPYLDVGGAPAFITVEVQSTFRPGDGPKDAEVKAKLSGLDGLATGTSVMVFGAYTLIGIWQFGQSCTVNPGPTCYEVRDPLDLAAGGLELCVTVIADAGFEGG